MISAVDKHKKKSIKNYNLQLKYSQHFIGFLINNRLLDWIVAEGRTIHFLGDIYGLGQEILQKLILSQALTSVVKEHYQSVTTKLSTELTFVDNIPHIFEECSISKQDVILYFDFNNTEFDPASLLKYSCHSIVISNNTNVLNVGPCEAKLIVIHDMIHYTNLGEHNITLDKLYEKCLDNRAGGAINMNEKHWWVSQQDVASSVISLVGDVTDLPLIMHLSGRRGWTLEETYQQLQMLYDRTIAGLTGHFDAQHLESRPVIGQLPQPVNKIEQSTRPDLSALDATLQAIDGQRWRPLVPLRTSLMHYLASKGLSQSV